MTATHLYRGGIAPQFDVHGMNEYLDIYEWYGFLLTLQQMLNMKTCAIRLNFQFLDMPVATADQPCGSICVSNLFRGACAAGANVRGGSLEERLRPRRTGARLRAAALWAAISQASSRRANGAITTCPTWLSWRWVFSWFALARSPVGRPRSRGRRNVHAGRS